MAWTPTSFEQSIAEFYTILLEEHLILTLVSISDQSSSMMFSSGDCAGQEDT
jgi:hypothetical protein